MLSRERIEPRCPHSFGRRMVNTWPPRAETGDLIEIQPPYNANSIEGLAEAGAHEAVQIKRGEICQVLRITGNFYGDDIYHLKCFGSSKVVVVNDYVSGSEWYEIISDIKET